MLRSFLPLIMFAVACSTPAEVSVEVQDIWGAPVAEAKVIQEGVTEHRIADKSGKLTFESEPATLRLMGGADGYIRDLQTITIAEDDESASVVLTLFPEPSETGFFAIDRKGPYKMLEQAPLKTVSTELTTYHGVENAPSVSLARAKQGGQRFVLRSDLRAEDLARFNLKLSKLKHLDKTSSTSVLGDVEIDLDLWVADGEIEYDVKGMQSREHYLMTTSVALEAGVYAFYAQDILSDSGTQTVDKLPEEMRVIYPFEVK